MFKSFISKKRRQIIWLFAKYLFSRVQDAMILRSAAALSYTTLLAVVPFIAVMLAVFAFFPIFGDMRIQVQDMLIRYVMPDMIQNVQNYVTEFIGAAGKLTTFGLLGIALTAVFMLSTIEDSFNFIFQIKRRRKITTKIYGYAFIIIVCPLLIGSALYLKGYLFTLRYLNPENIIGYGWLAEYILPHLPTLFCLMFAYVLVPNKNVGYKNALYGALFASAAMFILRIGFGYFLALNVTYKTIYGALAAVPVLLVWMYLWWNVVLSGAILTAALEDFSHKKSLWRKMVRGE
ncbi:MAG: YihY family inner membrane protein [Alphaproteobacteria bacterium]|nr:YihY family inner membrane protein [Alphaproteobacteria bacterium]